MGRGRVRGRERTYANDDVSSQNKAHSPCRVVAHLEELCVPRAAADLLGAFEVDHNVGVIPAWNKC